MAGVNSINPGFNRQQEQQQSVQNLQQLLGKQIQQHSQNEAEQNLQQLRGQQQAQQQQAQAQQSQQQLAQQGQQAQDLAKYKDTLGQEGTQRNVNTLQGLLKSNPGMGGSIGENGNVGLTKPIPEGNPMADVRRDMLNSNIVKNVTSDYDKRTAGMKTAMQSAQSIVNALDSGDIQTLGQIKANLPRLEGEKFKPTDAERQMMIQPTAQGQLERLKNYFMGDSAALSENQKKAIKTIVQQKIQNAQKDMDASKNEVTQRWNSRMQGLSPQEQQDIAESLGSSTGAVMGTMNSPQQTSAKPQVDPQDQAAAQWLQANPNHPAAAGVAAKLKAKGMGR